MGEVASFTGPASVGERKKLSGFHGALRQGGARAQSHSEMRGGTDCLAEVVSAHFMGLLQGR